MTQADRDYQHDFLVRCEEAYNLLQHFLNDTLPWGNVSPRRHGYIYDKELRNTVKEKVLLTMEKLTLAIKRYGYV